MEKITIAMIHYLDDARIGGSLRVGQLLANSLDSIQAKVHLIFVYGSPGPVGKVSRVPCYYPKVKGRLDILGWLRVRKLLRDLKPDIIHFQDPLTVLRLFIGDLAKIKITHCHGKPLFPPKTWLQKLQGYWQRQTTDYFVCINPSAAKTLVEFQLAYPQQCLVLPNAVDVSWLEQKPDRLTARKILNLPLDCKILGMVGRVIESKGFPDLFKTIQKLPTFWQVAIFGDGQDRARLEDQSKSLEIDNRVHFLGSLDDVRVAYSAMDALIFLSQHEPFGLILAEAMACQIPVFGLHGLGEYQELSPPLIDKEVAQFWERENPSRFLEIHERPIPENDIILEPLWDALSHFDSDSLKSQVETAYRRICEHYDVKIQVKRMTAIYQKILNPDYDN